MFKMNWYTLGKKPDYLQTQSYKTYLRKVSYTENIGLDFYHVLPSNFHIVAMSLFFQMRCVRHPEHQSDNAEREMVY